MFGNLILAVHVIRRTIGHQSHLTRGVLADNLLRGFSASAVDLERAGFAAALDQRHDSHFVIETRLGSLHAFLAPCEGFVGFNDTAA